MVEDLFGKQGSLKLHPKSRLASANFRKLQKVESERLIELECGPG